MPIVLDQTTLKVNDVVFLKLYDMLSNSSVSITVDNRLQEPQKFFYFIQVHAYLHEVILKWRAKNDTNYERGTNVGQIFKHKGAGRNQSILLINPSVETTVSLMIVLLVYEVDKTPVPGYCSSAIGEYIRPSLNTSTLEDTISTFFVPAKGLQEEKCGSENSSVSYELRFIYFGKNEYSPVVYFDTIQKLMVAAKAQDVGQAFEGKVDLERMNRRLFSRYAGMGLFFAVILRDTSDESYVPISYVPSVSYGCPGPGPVLGEHRCDLIGRVFN